MKPVIILGAGVTGLAAGITTGWPIYEAEEYPGGICSSYYMRPGDSTRLPTPPDDGQAYRFETGGGHWIFGADQELVQFITSYSPLNRYERRSSVFFPDKELYVPYPLQNHLSYLDKDLRQAALHEISRNVARPATTMAEWLEMHFGKTLCNLFFFPFHELYTAGLYRKIAPQDQYKSPVEKSLILKGANDKTPAVGYNAKFLYPMNGLNKLTQCMAQDCLVHFNKKVVGVNLTNKELSFADGSGLRYERLLSTIPLNRMLELCGLATAQPADPFTSVLVLNIGAVRGPLCPDDHWLYIPYSRSGFHRVGFYSNVDSSFLPLDSRKDASRVGIYVERSLPGHDDKIPLDINAYSRAVVEELQSWGFIADVEVMDATWIPIAYTWSWPGSNWRTDALNLLAKHNILQVGRYARWRFQGIAESIRDGRLTAKKF